MFYVGLLSSVVSDGQTLYKRLPFIEDIWKSRAEGFNAALALSFDMTNKQRPNATPLSSFTPAIYSELNVLSWLALLMLP